MASYAKYIPDATRKWMNQGMESGVNVMIQTIPVVAVVSSLFFAVSPWDTIKEIRVAKSTKRYSFSPFYFYTLQSFLFFVYAVLTSNTLLKGTTFVGLVFGLYYMTYFYIFAQDKRTIQIIVLASVIICSSLVWESCTQSNREAQMMIGLAGNIVMILTAASPLGQLRYILSTKDASCIPFGMSVMNVIAGGIWTMYGILLEDMLVIFPNFVTLAMGLVQLGLVFLYPRTSSKKMRFEKKDII